ncbi:MAG: helix-turn-helix transcriptional regulator [Cyclobacteriaceae bacterium]
MLISIAQMVLAMQLGIHLFVIALLLVNEKEAKHPRLYLAILIISIWALRCFFYYIKFEEWALNFPFLLVIDQYLLLLDGLLLWLFSRSFLEKKFSFKIFLHFIPFGFFLIGALIYSIQNPLATLANFNDSISAILNGDPIVRPEVIIFFLAVLLISVFYFIRSRKEVKSYSITLKDNFSNIHRINIDWVLTYQKLWLSLFVIPLIFYALNYVYPAVSVQITASILIASMLFLSLYFNFHILSQKHTKLESTNAPPSTKLTEIPSDEDKVRLERLFQQLNAERYYENEQLSLDQLAEKMGIKPVELTQLIKKSAYENFYDLINSFRVEAVKNALLQSSEQIIIIAYQCGFNSKSAFNKIFKDKTGLTPKEFRNNKSI